MTKIFREENNGMKFLSYHDNHGFYYPYIDSRIENMSKNGPFDNWLWEKYTTKNIFVKSTDTVIDCGSFVGSFSIASCYHNANKIYAIEPSTKNFECLLENIKHHNFSEKVVPFQIGLGNKNTNLRLNLSELTCENSFLKCDSGSTGEYEEVSVKTLSSFIDDNNIDCNNLYLKVEAEGFEPEVIYGLEDKRPRVIVVDVTEERNASSPRIEIEEHLVSFGYKFKRTPRCLFAY